MAGEPTTRPHLIIRYPTQTTIMKPSTAFFPCNSDSFIDYYVLLLQKNDSYNYSPHVSSFIFATIISILVFLISTLTGNFSQVDKLWSILPAIYAWVCYASAPTTNDTRIIVMTFLVSAWSIRLTYNSCYAKRARRCGRRCLICDISYIKNKVLIVCSPEQELLYHGS